MRLIMIHLVSHTLVIEVLQLYSQLHRNQQARGQTAAVIRGGGGGGCIKVDVSFMAAPPAHFHTFQTLSSFPLASSPLRGRNNYDPDHRLRRVVSPGASASHTLLNMCLALNSPCRLSQGLGRGLGFWEGWKGDNGVDLDFRSGCGRGKKKKEGGTRGPAA